MPDVDQFIVRRRASGTVRLGRAIGLGLGCHRCRPTFPGANADGKPATWPDPTGGAAGVWATPAGDGKGDVPSTLGTDGSLRPDRPQPVLDQHGVGLVTGFLVMFMQAGFAMVETGMCRAKNAAHTFAMNFMIYPLGCLGFWAYGFAFGWGNWFNGPVAARLVLVARPRHLGAQSGHRHCRKVRRPRAPRASSSVPRSPTPPCSALFFFMMVFMDTTATIPTGAMAERWAWKNFVLYGLWVALPYCIYANWVWGGGWLAQGGVNWHLGHGAVDFAGSGVVHAMGGIIALAGAIVIGPRIGKYVNGKPQAIPGASHADGHRRLLHPRVRLVRVQPGLDARRHRPAHLLRRRQHDAGERGRRLRRHDLPDGPAA